MPSSVADAALTNGNGKPPSKKAKLEEPPPPYGSQEYWETRYKQNQNVSYTASKEAEALPYHAWYFTYSDLRPIILPLLLGGKNTERIDSQHLVVLQDTSDTSEIPQEREKIGDGKSAIVATKDQNVIANDASKGNSKLDGGAVTGDRHQDEDDADEESSEDNDGGGDISSDVEADGDISIEEEISEEVDDGEDRIYGDAEKDSEFVEVDDSDNDDDDDDDDDDEEAQERDGVARCGPVSVLEVGCGDVPLGRDLILDLISLEKNTSTKVDAIIKKIVCCDYSSAVIALLTEQKEETNGLNSINRATLHAILDFQVADARTMSQYHDMTFELVLEKGTLDALLSDKETGKASCQKVMKEMARVLTTGGYILLVSHLNAHMEDGLEWLQDIVMPGLQAGSEDASWEIEVHGNAELYDAGGQICSPGPCVYIIHKMGSQSEGDGVLLPTIPLRFFSY